MIRILTVIGARPQIIKSAAISRAVRDHFSDRMEECILHTGQHYDDNMSDVFFREMEIPEPHIQLRGGGGSHGSQMARMLEGIEVALQEIKPDALLVYGDTNSTLAAALAASRMHIPVIHVEAGLRSFEKRMPEEINRLVCDHVCSLLFVPTSTGMKNLEREGFRTGHKGPFDINHPGVFHCGDIMLDNCLHFADRAAIPMALTNLGIGEGEYVLATVHRDSNTDDPVRLASICEALAQIAERKAVVIPLHPRTEKMLAQWSAESAIQRFVTHPRVHRIAPTSYLEMLALERSSGLIITDSGGVQKEAFFLKKPSIILRPQTEWTEIVENGNALLADADVSRILSAESWFAHATDLSWPSFYGDGHAAEFICETILSAF